MGNVITNSSTIQLKDRGGGDFGSIVSNPLFSVSRNGITWTFDQAATVGEFANGDPWVVGPITITGITPADATIGRNGTMVNPAISLTHGFDNRLLYGTYDSGIDITQSLPYAVATGSSVCSCVSVAEGETAGDQQYNSKVSYTEQVEILTVLSSAPATGAFRPPYTGADKSIIATISDIDYSKLGSVAQPNSGINVPLLADVEAYYAHPYYEQFTQWQGGLHHPVLNFPRGQYGRDIARVTSEALLSLQLDYTNEEKQTLLYRVIQAGIDIYGVVRDGNEYTANGGHNLGRKGLMVCAATVLDNAAMKVWCDGTLHPIFQEDQNTFIVSQAEVDITNGGYWIPDDRGGTPVPYVTDDIGTGEWGIRHFHEPEKDNADWGAQYRTQNCNQMGSATAIEIMGATAVWNHDPFFVYHERSYAITSGDANGSSLFMLQFTRDMHAAYGGFP